MKWCTLHTCPHGGEKDSASLFNRDVGIISMEAKEAGLVQEVDIVMIKSHKDIVGFKKYGINVILEDNVLRLYYYLIKNARDIDVLHLYHIWKHSLLMGLIYRILHPKGFLYIKTDMPLQSENIDHRISIANIPTLLMRCFLWSPNIVGFESRALLDYVVNLYPRFANKLTLTTSGISIIKKFIGNIDKEKSIVLCGRFGSDQKNNELLLDVLKDEDISFLYGWKINLIGGMTLEFQERLQCLLKTNPKLNAIIIQHGFLHKKSDIYSIMAKARIFLHTAKYEGDPNIQYDSMFCGCYMLSTDVGNIKQNYPVGCASFFSRQDRAALYKALKETVGIYGGGVPQSFYQNIQNYSLEHFRWSRTLEPLFSKIIIK